MSVTVNDVHAQLNEASVSDVIVADGVEDIQQAMRRSASEGTAVAVAGGRHAMGGQQFCSNGLLVDTRGMNRVLEFDSELGTLDVEAGIQWPEVIGYLADTQAGRDVQWGIAQKQTGADRLSIGGALAANVHGRGLAMTPMIGDVESFVLVKPDGSLATCTREENPELFRLAIGGYGLFGCVYSARIRLLPRQTLERVVEVRLIDELTGLFEERIRRSR